MRPQPPTAALSGLMPADMGIWTEADTNPGPFETILPKGLATAAVDRLLHHAHVIVTEGRSHRLTEALDGRGVAPLEVTEA